MNEPQRRQAKRERHGFTMWFLAIVVIAISFLVLSDSLLLVLGGIVLGCLLILVGGWYFLVPE